MFLIHCLESKAVKSQKVPLTKLIHIGRSQNPFNPSLPNSSKYGYDPSPSSKSEIPFWK